MNLELTRAMKSNISRAELIDIPDSPHNAESNQPGDDIWKMFDRIAPRYDLLNRLLSFGQDIRWRKKIVATLPKFENQQLLDLATGTADVLLGLEASPAGIEHGIGLDMSGEMLKIGRRKIMNRKKSEKLSLIRADATRIPFADSTFEIVTIAFGIRNVNADQGQFLISSGPKRQHCGISTASPSSKSIP